MRLIVAKKQTVIVGLGKTGLSCARYLRSVGRDFTVMDSRLNPPGLTEFQDQFPTIEPRLGGFSQSILNSAEEIILSPGVGVSTPEIQIAINAGVLVRGDIDIFSKEVKSPFVAVTGSNGKSTVVSLLNAMVIEAGLQVLLGGNHDGVEASPALDLLLQERPDLYILELSSFQLETTRKLGAKVAVILNISEDHMDRYSSLDDYEEAKQRIFIGCHQVVVNREQSASIPRHWQGTPQSSFGLNSPGQGEWGILVEDDKHYLAFGEEKLIGVEELKIRGRHNVGNALAALALGDALRLPLPAMLNALRTFPGLPHRCQWLRSHLGVEYYNDSKGTNVGASLEAVRSLGELANGKIILIAGGVDKNADFSPMIPVVSRFVKLVILIGRDANKIAEIFNNYVEVCFSKTLTEAVNVAQKSGSPGDIVLLSPACASFDMFTDFTHRGRVFTESVEALT
jgi:UDP-N-acetylmuramoylalanine--D-glutamate ligase